MPVFTTIGTAILATGAVAAGASAFAVGVGATVLAGAAGAMASSSHQAQKGAAGQQRAATQHAQGVQAEEAKKSQDAILKMEEESKATAAEMKAAPGIAAEEARKESIRRRASRAKTLLTSPQGALGQANVQKKTLLGG